MTNFLKHTTEAVPARGGNCLLFDWLRKISPKFCMSRGRRRANFTKFAGTADETAIIDDGANIGDKTRIWHWTHICSGANIGSNCVLGQNVFIASRVKIGNNVKIQNNVSVYDDVILEDDVFCGPAMVFTNVINPRAHIERKNEYRQTLVKKGASLGANSTIICGNIIGEYAMIGAGAVITKDVKPHALMVGVPAKQIGFVSHAGEILDKNLLCPREKRQYYIDNKGYLQEKA